MTDAPGPTAVDAELLSEAADWVMRRQEGPLGDDEAAQWRHWQQRSRAHAEAWQRAERVLATFAAVPAPLTRAVAGRLPDASRRQIVKAMAMVAVTPAAVWIAARQAPWQTQFADLRTATGEQVTRSLPDGSSLVLNTGSALDLRYTASERRLFLHAGEVFVTTASDASGRPFLVSSSGVTVQALGTRFSVRRLDSETTHVAVFEHAVEVRSPDRPALRLNAGEQARFGSQSAISLQPVHPGESAWTQGMLVARDLPLHALIAELNRYRPGRLRCHPAVGQLRVSGAFPLRDTDASLDLLRKTLPVDIGRSSRWWVTVEPRR